MEPLLHYYNRGVDKTGPWKGTAFSLKMIFHTSGSRFVDLGELPVGMSAGYKPSLHHQLGRNVRPLLLRGQEGQRVEGRSAPTWTQRTSSKCNAKRYASVSYTHRFGG